MSNTGGSCDPNCDFPFGSKTSCCASPFVGPVPVAFVLNVKSKTCLTPTIRLSEPFAFPDRSTIAFKWLWIPKWVLAMPTPPAGSRWKATWSRSLE